jgi:hypothetical protein
VEREIPTVDVLAERIHQHEYIQRAMQVEIHDLRTEHRASLRADYLTRAEMRNEFVTRAELSDRAAVRREWPLIATAVALTAMNAVNLIFTLRGGR